MGKYRPKVLPAKSIVLRVRKEPGLGLCPISNATLVRAGQIKKSTETQDLQKICQNCGLKVWSKKWTEHWKKSHKIRRKTHMKPLLEGECPSQPDWLEPIRKGLQNIQSVRVGMTGRYEGDIVTKE